LEAEDLTEEPAAEEPTAEEPAAEEPTAEEPIAEEAVEEEKPVAEVEEEETPATKSSESEETTSDSESLKETEDEQEEEITVTLYEQTEADIADLRMKWSSVVDKEERLREIAMFSSITEAVDAAEESITKLDDILDALEMELESLFVKE